MNDHVLINLKNHELKYWNYSLLGDSVQKLIPPKTFLTLNSEIGVLILNSTLI